jgi:hypothetical protein
LPCPNTSSVGAGQSRGPSSHRPNSPCESNRGPRGRTGGLYPSPAGSIYEAAHGLRENSSILAAECDRRQVAVDFHHGDLATVTFRRQDGTVFSQTVGGLVYAAGRRGTAAHGLRENSSILAAECDRRQVAVDFHGCHFNIRTSSAVKCWGRAIKRTQQSPAKLSVRKQSRTSRSHWGFSQAADDINPQCDLEVLDCFRTESLAGDCWVLLIGPARHARLPRSRAPL